MSNPTGLKFTTGGYDVLGAPIISPRCGSPLLPPLLLADDLTPTRHIQGPPSSPHVWSCL